MRRALIMIIDYARRSRAVAVVLVSKKSAAKLSYIGEKNVLKERKSQ
jgi:hypothetical protein